MRYFVFRYKTHIILSLSFKNYPIFEHLTSFMEQLLMYFRRHKRKKNKRGKGTFRHQIISALRCFGTKTFRTKAFLCTSHSKTGQGITMAETLTIILAEHNVPINFADYFTKLVSNKLVFPDSVFLRTCSARTLLTKRSHPTRCHYLFFQKLNMSANSLQDTRQNYWTLKYRSLRPTFVLRSKVAPH